MQLIEGRLDYTKPWAKPDAYLFTGNSTVKSNGAIVMGRGAARQVRDHFPGIDKRYGEMLLDSRMVDPLDPTILWANLGNKQFLGWFRVKGHWGAPARLDLIEASTKELRQYAVDAPSIKFHMNYPGIGNGRLKVDDVSPILAMLPDNVLIYK